MLRSCAIMYSSSWDVCLTFAEFAYNNSHQVSINMSPYEALYGRDCRTLLNWSEVGERRLYGSKLVQEAEEKVDQIHQSLSAAQERYKAYANDHTRKMDYQVGDYAYLKVTPFEGTQRFQEKGKLAPKYVGPFKIYAKRGEVAYALALPDSLMGIHHVFHISQLKRCIEVPTDLVELQEIDLDQNLSYKEYPNAILDFSERKTRTKTIKLLKVQWSRHLVEKATWEVEDTIGKLYPLLFDLRYHQLLCFSFGLGLNPYGWLEGNKKLFSFNFQF